MPDYNILSSLSDPNVNKILGALPNSNNNPQNQQNSGLAGIGSLLSGLAQDLHNMHPEGTPALNSSQNTLNAPIGQINGLGSMIPRHQTQQQILSNNLGPFQNAQKYLGMTTSSNDDILKGFMQKTGQNIDPANTPWCAAFANGILKSSGLKGTGSLAARSFLNYGTPTNQPSKGDLVVFSDLTGKNDPTHGHVGFYAGMDSNGNILTLGGNESGGVAIKAYPASKVLGFRQPPSGQQIQQSILPKDANPELGHVMQGISYVESGGDYNSISKPARDGMRSYGKYQISGHNIPSWTNEALGHPLSIKQFLSDPQAQEQTAAFHINKLLQTGNNPQDVASIWFSGRPQNKAGNARDTYGTTVPEYVKKFNQGYLKSKTISSIAPFNPKQAMLLATIKEKPPIYNTGEINPPDISHEKYEDIVDELDKGHELEG